MKANVRANVRTKCSKHNEHSERNSEHSERSVKKYVANDGNAMRFAIYTIYNIKKLNLTFSITIVNNCCRDAEPHVDHLDFVKYLERLLGLWTDGIQHFEGSEQNRLMDILIEFGKGMVNINLWF
uniref:Uncharacterized protein n=1 Tax=Rhizophagus irregularis (strain DAOM 181602 / DAOM 197198 / MUCL 43194) TaxID=747089 RepID=U9SQQ2_RHIID